MNLAELLNKVKVIQVLGLPETHNVSSITIDSREVKKGSIFVAVKGFKTDGHKFIPDAISNGASAVILDDASAIPDEIFIKSGVTKIIVENSRKSLAEFSNYLFEEPSKKLTLVGITGTKGKTTTSYFMKNVFDNAGIKSGLLGTNKNIIGDREIKSKLTTPEANEINFLLNEMVKEGCTHCVMEVSSHSLALDRVDYLDFDFAIFSNISSDHMDYHQTFENYLEAKELLFENLKETSTAVINLDDKSSKEIISKTNASVKTYGQNTNADFIISDVQYNLNGTKFSISDHNSSYSINTKLIGKFNAYNATAAFSTAVLMGLEAPLIVEGIKNTPQVPGRFEVVSHGIKKVIVDYSHTAGSLKEALEAIHHINSEKKPIYTVFGCGGDRDKFKRPEMGRIAEELSDKVIVTSDNPRSEDPNKIIEDIISGFRGKNYLIIENREEAIKTAIHTSPVDAIILIAGKGHENYQEINGIRKHFSDKETAEKYLKVIE